MSSKSQQDIYLQATPAGAYYCTRQESTDTASRLLRYLLGAASTPLYSLTDVSSWLDCSETKVQEVLRHMEKIRWLQNLTEPRY
ncbi:MAG: hypothetical protein MI976_24940, partial [Pseudomonadales bacterium]|nr:hypothetical protein [Pseudomonadales bacterium]